MRPAEVSAAEVIEAGQHLLAEGRRVNGWSLRRAVGDRGRPERLIAEWERAQAEGAPEAQPPGQPGPVVLPPGVAEMADQARTALLAQFDGILLSVVRQAEGELKARYKADFDRIAAERADMEEQLSVASASVGATEGTLAESQAEAYDLRRRFAEVEKAAAVAAERLRSTEEKARADAADAEAQITELTAKLRAFGAAAQEAQKAQAAAEATAAAAEREAERLRGEVERLRREHDVARTEASAIRTELATSKADAAALRERVTRAETDIERLHGERDAADAAARQAAERVGAAEARAEAAASARQAAERAAAA